MRKQYGCDIVLSQHTYDLCSNKVWVRELDLIRVKGKLEPVKIYDLISDRTCPLSDDMKHFLERYNQGREAYKAMAFERAAAHFTSALALQPDDQAAALHLSRAQQYLQRPPDENWDGVHTMTTK